MDTCSGGFSESGFEPSTLVELLRFRALHQPQKRAYTFLEDGDTKEIHLTYEELDRRAQIIAARLQCTGATEERVLILHPPGLEYIAAFFGCLYAGAVAVPAYPPRRNRSISRLQAIVADAQATVALTTTRVLSDVEKWFSQAANLAALRWLATDGAVSDVAEEWHDPLVTSDTLAFLQYTSGSTSTPKGVMVSHDNLLHNERMIEMAFEHTMRSIVVGWLPLYHDMGLIGNMLQPLYVGIPGILMSPVDFLQRPLRWLAAISRYKATTSGGPNFAYDLCVRKIKPQSPFDETLDLSSWRLAFNGSETVRHETLDRFTATFEPFGFRKESFYPCYGLAEATLFTTGGSKTVEPVVHTIQTNACEQNQVISSAIKDKGTKTLVSCGRSWLDQRIVIADPDTLIGCPPGRIGEIWVSGASVAQGYWNQLEETKHTFQAYLADTGEGPFLRTGDLGFLKAGELFVTGRLKDLIIIRGRNHYPQDIELTVEQSHPALRPGCGAAFSVEVDGDERLVVVQEVERHYQNQNLDEVVGDIRQAVAENHELQVYIVLLLKTLSIPKTSSGKIRRSACRDGFLSQNLQVLDGIDPRFHDSNPNM
jgi:acyl-CoA synthetase (AMP-forming)/AMP-acid ligase II